MLPNPESRASLNVEGGALWILSHLNEIPRLNFLLELPVARQDQRESGAYCLKSATLIWRRLFVA